MKNSNHNKINEFDAYHPDHVPLFEAIYGKNLISLGGLAAIDNMFSDLNIQSLKALDIGFGIGGVAFYLAEKYKMKVAGIEIYPWMVEYARTHTPINLSNSLEFHTYNSNGSFPYDPVTFDLVYSKGVLNHVADKVSLFKQINTVLKPNGLLVIADWIFPIAATELAPLVCETKESYEQALLTTGFSEISFRDDSKLFLNYAKELLTRLSDNKAFIKQKYGEELFLIIQKQHEELIEKIQQHQKIATRIVAKKTS
jgi:SAM-dependent methyltransferase